MTIPVSCWKTILVIKFGILFIFVFTFPSVYSANDDLNFHPVMLDENGNATFVRIGQIVSERYALVHVNEMQKNSSNKARFVSTWSLAVDCLERPKVAILSYYLNINLNFDEDPQWGMIKELSAPKNAKLTDLSYYYADNWVSDSKELSSQFRDLLMASRRPGAVELGGAFACLVLNGKSRAEAEKMLQNAEGLHGFISLYCSNGDSTGFELKFREKDHLVHWLYTWQSNSAINEYKVDVSFNTATLSVNRLTGNYSMRTSNSLSKDAGSCELIEKQRQRQKF